MFRRLFEPLPLSEASLLVLRPAMNAPVLNVGFLPIGPARAAVIAFAEEYGGIGIALGVRSNESGQIVVLRNQESIDFDVPLSEALEPLYAEAERMGFLFDEDMLEAGQPGRAAALAHWADLMGGIDRLVPAPMPEPPPRSEEDVLETAGPLSPSQAMEEAQYPELMLDDVAPLTLEDDEPSDGPTEAIEADAVETFEAVGPDERDGTDASEDLEADDPLGLGIDDLLQGAPLDDEDDLLDAEPDFDAAAALAPAEPEPTVESGEAGAPRSDLLFGREAVGASSPRAMPTRREPKPGRLAPLTTIAIARAVTGPDAPAPAPVSAAPALAPAPAPEEAPPVRPAASVLSKFRQSEQPTNLPRRPDDAKSERRRDESKALARIPIVRVRKNQGSSRREPLLARLLSSF